MKSWMIFRIESNFVHYLWNGETVILIHLPLGVDPNPYYWMGDPSKLPPTKEAEQLNMLATTKNKVRIFKLPLRGKMRFYIVAKGEFVEE